MTKLTRFLLALAVLAMASAPIAALAEPPDEADRALIRTMIRSQIDAFHADDGEAAFAHASPTIQKLFARPDHFMTMVEQGYLPVYRARSVTFGSILEIEAAILQQVFLVGPRGKSWIALYNVQQQGDGSWRINGVQIAPNQGSLI